MKRCVAERTFQKVMLRKVKMAGNFTIFFSFFFKCSKRNVSLQPAGVGTRLFLYFLFLSDDLRQLFFPSFLDVKRIFLHIFPREEKKKHTRTHHFLFLFIFSFLMVQKPIRDSWKKNM